MPSRRRMARPASSLDRRRRRCVPPRSCAIRHWTTTGSSSRAVRPAPSSSSTDRRGTASPRIDRTAVDGRYRERSSRALGSQRWTMPPGFAQRRGSESQPSPDISSSWSRRSHLRSNDGSGIRFLQMADSCRSAVAGSIRAARSAGTTAAATVTTSIIPPPPRSVGASVGWTCVRATGSPGEAPAAVGTSVSPSGRR